MVQKLRKDAAADLISSQIPRAFPIQVPLTKVLRSDFSQTCTPRHRWLLSGRVPDAPWHHAGIPVSLWCSKLRSSWPREFRVSQPKRNLVCNKPLKPVRTLHHKVGQCVNDASTCPVPAASTWFVINIFSTLVHIFMARAADKGDRAPFPVRHELCFWRVNMFSKIYGIIQIAVISNNTPSLLFFINNWAQEYTGRHKQQIKLMKLQTHNA